MTQYDEKFELPIVSPPQSMEHLLGNQLAEANLRNLRTAETEKFAHVTFFFNGGREKPFAGEERILTPSPKVATYDLLPEMSSVGVGDSIEKAILDTAFDVVVSNFANPDMVGHTGVLPAAIKAVEAVDLPAGPHLQGRQASATPSGSSPPTTATARPWWTPSPASRTPRTPPTRCR